MQEIAEKLKNAIKDLYGLDFNPEITPAPENINADYSSNAPLKLAKELHKSPMQIAEELNQKLNVNISNPGFLNFVLSDDYLQKNINDLCKDFASSIDSNEFSGKTIVAEFSDPNPFKILHAGHLYTSIMGDAFSRLYESAGAKVIRANFGGDVGLHVAKTIYILLQKKPDTLTIEEIGKCYVEGTLAYDDDEKAHEEITKLNKEIYKINNEDIHGTPLSDLYWKGRELSYEYFKDFYASIGVKFDKYYPESSVANLGLETVKRELEKGVYEYSDGAVVFKGEKYGLHTRVFINKEGVPTYEAKDVGLIFQKDKDYHFDKSVVITGSEQLDYMKVVLKSVEQYAPELVAKTTHLTHGLVKLPGNVKMSSRKGNFLKAVDVINLVKSALKEAYNSTDEKVSLAAIKYAFLKYKMGGDIIFDPNESVKMTGNSGPYLLYSCVRAKKILSSVGDNSKGEKYAFEAAEKNLIKKILEYKNVLQEATAEMAPHKLANYLYELAQEFSRFYENCPVAGSDKEQERAKIVRAYLNTMTHGLNILGIDIPEEM
ncbi:arginine--tRNA ligase [Candidatus Saccharibacteria bacterium]|nr:arginine--tRNA ligase [Candidatus Saccharibacteria bacterium]